MYLIKILTILFIIINITFVRIFFFFFLKINFYYYLKNQSIFYKKDYVFSYILKKLK